MNPFLNPKNGITALESLIFDPGRLQRLNSEEIEKYRDKALKKIVKYAYTVPLYHKKYKLAGIHPDDIKSIKDIVKLPFITKNDLITHFPDEILPVGYNKKKAKIICTSGSSGKPVSIYTDFPTMAKVTGVNLRVFYHLKLHWRKTKIAHIGNCGATHPDDAYEKGFFSKTRLFYPTKNIMSINASNPIKKIIDTLNTFKPDIIVTYPATFSHLAYFKKKGYCDTLNPKYLIVGAAVTDEYTKKYVEDTFGCKMLNSYASTESFANISFECIPGVWHINHDCFHVEAIDENNEVVHSSKRGNVVITRMFGEGTPIIRYKGMDDWIRLSSDYQCDCGLQTPIIKGGVEGRVSTSIVLPDGRLLPSFQSYISTIFNDFTVPKIQRFQIVQNKIDEINISLVIDDDLREEGISVDTIFKKIKKTYQEKVGPDVTINVKEAKKLESSPGKPPPLVISHVKPEQGYQAIEW